MTLSEREQALLRHLVSVCREAGFDHDITHRPNGLFAGSVDMQWCVSITRSGCRIAEGRGKDLSSVVGFLWPRIQEALHARLQDLEKDVENAERTYLQAVRRLGRVRDETLALEILHEKPLGRGGT